MVTTTHATSAVAPLAIGTNSIARNATPPATARQSTGYDRAGAPRTGRNASEIVTAKLTRIPTAHHPSAGIAPVCGPATTFAALAFIAPVHA